jgi:transposase
MRVEVLNGVERRRRWSREEKMRILAESLEPGATVADVARRNDVAQSVLFSWRRQVRVPSAAVPTMVPVMIAEPSVATALVATKSRRTCSPAKKRGLIEIDLGGECRVRVDAGVDADALARVIDVLSRR